MLAHTIASSWHRIECSSKNNNKNRWPDSENAFASASDLNSNEFAEFDPFKWCGSFHGPLNVNTRPASLWSVEIICWIKFARIKFVNDRRCRCITWWFCEIEMKCIARRRWNCHILRGNHRPFKMTHATLHCRFNAIQTGALVHTNTLGASATLPPIHFILFYFDIMKIGE